MSFAPGEGIALGSSWGQQANEREFQAERDRLRRELATANDRALAASACKDAAKAVVNTMVTELAGGPKAERRLSDPGNISGRNEAFIDTAEGQLRRLSERHLGFAPESRNLIKHSKEEFGEALKSPTLKPRVVRS